MRTRAPVQNMEGELEYWLEPPQSQGHQNIGIVRLESLLARSKSYGQYLNETEISCLASEKRRLFVSAEGRVFPCCYLAHIYIRGIATPEIRKFSVC